MWQGIIILIQEIELLQDWEKKLAEAQLQLRMMVFSAKIISIMIICSLLQKEQLELSEKEKQKMKQASLANAAETIMRKQQQIKDMEEQVSFTVFCQSENTVNYVRDLLNYRKLSY